MNIDNKTKSRLSAIQDLRNKTTKTAELKHKAGENITAEIMKLHILQTKFCVLSMNLDAGLKKSRHVYDLMNEPELKNLYDAFLDKNPGLATAEEIAFASKPIIWFSSIIFHHYKATASSAYPCRFVLSESLAFGLHLTELDNTTGSDIKMPFDTFFIEIPPGAIRINTEGTTYNDVAYISVSKTYREEILGTCISFALFIHPNKDEPIGKIDALVFCADTPIEKKTENDEQKSASTTPLKYSIYWSDLADAFTRDYLIPKQMDNLPYDKKDLQKYVNDKMNSTPVSQWGTVAKNHKYALKRKGIVFNKEYSGSDFKYAVSKIIFNTILYINSSSAKITHGNQAEIDKLKPLAKGKKGQKMKAHQAQKKIQDLEQEPVWNLETKVELDPNLIKQYSKENQGTGTPRSHSWITRGHWRQQACGERWSKHKPKWIAPFVNLRHMPPTYGHEYTIKDPTGTDD
jgi:hypothetical protein